MDFRIRNDDIFLVSYPRSGNTWLRHLLACLRYPDRQWGHHNLNEAVPDMYEVGAGMDRLPSPRFIKSHEPYDSRYPKVIYLYRDPRDVAVSYYKMLTCEKQYTENFSRFLQTFVSEQLPYGSWARHIDSWIFRPHPGPRLNICYELLVADTENQLRKIAAFAGLHLSTSEITRAIEASAFHKLHKSVLQDLGKDPNRSSVWVKGGPGKWKEYFSPDDVRVLINRFGSIMQRLGYECNEATLPPKTSQRQLKVAEEHVKTGMQIDAGSSFAGEIEKLFSTVRPRKIIETGTYLGRGTTTVIARTLRKLGLEGTFYTIEVNPEYHRQAAAYFAAQGLKVNAVWGLSVPRSLLPGPEQIKEATITNPSDADLFVDHPEAHRVERYCKETDFQAAPDNRLYECLRRFDFQPDFVLLDSAGHMGFIEFEYLLQNLRGPCVIALDDICHVKHHKSFCLMQNDPRFKILVSSKEKFGFCIARFDPQGGSQPLQAEPQHILWLRPDAIGDAVLASSMLPAIRRRFVSARITVFTQDVTAPLYEYCPFVDEVIHFSESDMWHNPQFVSKWADVIRSRNVDCVLSSVYSRSFLMDQLVRDSGASLRIGLRGDCCNIEPAEKAQSDSWYTHLIESPGRWKPELERHADFLKGLGCPAEDLRPRFWLSPEDEAFARQWFKENGLLPDKTLALFAGARVYHRLYEGYGQALASFAGPRQLAVIALGGTGDFEINQRNLDRVAAEGVKTINLSGKLTLRQSAAILKQCRLALGAETGLAHITAALEVPHVILIGGGHFGRFMPYSPLTTLVALPLDCYGCDWKCRYGKDIHCIQKICPFTLTQAIEKAYRQSAEKPRIVVQDSYNRCSEGPTWKPFDTWIDMDAVELHTASANAEAPMKSNPPANDNEQPSIPDRPKAFTLSRRSRYPKITVVTPSFNQAKYLEACIQSVLSQNYPNLEYIIMDGGSTDGSVEIIKKYADRLTYWQSRPDGGQYQAIQDGFSRSTGQIMTWLNSDDMFFPDAFETAAAIFTQRPDIDWLTGRIVNFAEDGSVKVVVPYLPRWCRAKYLKKDYKNPYLQQEGTFWRRSLYEKAGNGMRTDLHLAGDLELWMRFFRHADLHTVDHKMAGYRLQPNRKIATLLDKYHAEADRLLDEELRDYFRQSNRPALPPPPLPISEEQVRLYRQSFEQACETAVPETRPACPPAPGGEVITLATSLAPGNIANQQRAVQSWFQCGFRVLSVNNPEEIQSLKPLFPEVTFIAAERNGKELFGKPLIYVDDLLAQLKKTASETVGIVNSDIYLCMGPSHQEEIRRRTADKTVLCLNRLNVENLGDPKGQIFVSGFDVFFFRREVIDLILPSRFCLGTAWWDYYLPLVCLLNGYSLARFRDPVAYHIKHPLNWDYKQWTSNAEYFFDRLRELSRVPGESNPLTGLEAKLRESSEYYRRLALKGYPDTLIRQSYSYGEFIVGLLIGRMKILDGFAPQDRPDSPAVRNEDASVSESSAALRVSAIVSTYNAEIFIRGCLQDLVEQTLYRKGQLEIIVINSGSEQNEDAIIREFMQKYPHIRYIKTEQREGLYAAWNRGVRAARGRYLTNANTDDRHRADALEVMADELDRHPELGLVYGDQIVTEMPNDRFESHHGTDFTPRPDYSPQRLLFGCCVGSQPMWRKALHEELGYFDETLTVASDWDFWLRIAARYPMKRIGQFLGLYYRNDEGLEHSQKIHSLYERYVVGKRHGNPYISTIPIYEHPDNPLVSVIIPVYNGADYLRQAIESVLIQNYRNFELIIVNDGSTDATEQVVKAFDDSRIRYFSQANAGPSAARNRAIRESQGRFIINLDHDDMLMPDHIAQLLAAYDRYPEADMIYCNTMLIREDGAPIRLQKRKAYDRPEDLIGDLFQAGYPIIPFLTLIRRSVFDRIGYYDESLKVAEDYDMLRRFAAAGLTARFYPGAVYLRRNREESQSKTATPEKARMHFSVMRRYLETFRPDQLFPQVRWDTMRPEQKDYLLGCLAAKVFVTLGEQYVSMGYAVCLSQAACECAMEQLSHCQRICPNQPAVLALLERCRRLQGNGSGYFKRIESAPAASLPATPDVSPQRSLTVCMAAYNAQATVEEAIRSVLAQTWKDFELIFVDDGSTDATLQIVRSFNDPRIRVAVQDHKHFAAAMNHALRLARGEWIISVDADDRIEPDYLETMMRFAAQHPGFDYYYPSRLNLMDEQGRKTGEVWEYPDFDDSRLVPEFLFQYAFSPVPNAGSLKRRALFEKTGPFRELENAEDFDFLARHALDIRFRRVTDAQGYCYRISSAGNTGRYEVRNRITLRVLEEMLRRYPAEILYPRLGQIADPDEKARQFRRLLVETFERHGRYYGEHGQIFHTYAERLRRRFREIESNRSGHVGKIEPVES